MSRPEPDTHKVFPSSQEAHAEADRLNRDPPEWGYSPWYVGMGKGTFSVIRTRRVIAEDLDIEPREYEERCRDGVARSAANRDFWRRANEMEIEDVSLDGEYPETKLLVLFRTNQKPQCLFGIRRRIWPAEDTNLEYVVEMFDVYFMEYFRGGRPWVTIRGDWPCNAEGINWLPDD